MISLHYRPITWFQRDGNSYRSSNKDTTPHNQTNFTTVLRLVVFIFNVVILWEQKPVSLSEHFVTYHAILFVAKFQQMA